MSPYPKSLFLLFLIYSLCFLGGSFNHARDVLLGGFLPYRHAPFFFNAFWTSLTFIDPIVPLLFFFRRPKYAMVLALAIMILDVTMNTYFAANYRDSIYADNIDLQAQTAFLLFLVGTVPLAWKAVSRRQRDRTMR